MDAVQVTFFRPAGANGKINVCSLKIFVLVKKKISYKKKETVQELSPFLLMKVI